MIWFGKDIEAEIVAKAKILEWYPDLPNRPD
jgi:hypothetical protein